jgi:hypothetical protein
MATSFELERPLDAAGLAIRTLPLPVGAQDAARYADLHIAGPLLNNAFREITGTAFPTEVIWWTSAAKVAKIVSLDITRNANQTPATEVTKVFKDDGVTILYTVTDTMTYSGVFETSRVRTVV